ncbi:hypothetical protein Tco_0980338 [Tanacetum coccineum]
MSGDSAVTYTSVHYEARSWKYVHDPMELEDHVPVYIPEPEHPEDLVPAEDEAPIPLLPPSFLSLRIRPLCPRALATEMRDVASSLNHSLHPSGTPPLLHIPLPVPSTTYYSQTWVFVDTMETRFRDTERRMMTALEMVNMRKDRAAVRAEIEVLRRERLAYEQESMETRQV